MNYKEFKQLVEQRFTEYLAGEYRRIGIKVVAIRKTNRLMDGIVLNLIDEKPSPVIYIDEMYEDYRSN